MIPIKNFILNIFIILLLFPAGFSSVCAQQIQLEGVIRDSLQNPISYTNIIASPLSEDHSITFAITDEQGRYRLKLEPEVAYLLEITHLGYSKKTDTVNIASNTIKNFTLFESTQALEAVIIEQQMAVIVAEDTITYRVDQFRTGEERKLRELLKNLPGVEVDREGNVTVNGKKVTKLLVEGKTFFTGDTKLGVNNIPADAVEEVVALDNYTEVAFLKGLSDSNQLALNIKLKEGKKKFVFGDIEAGGGIEERYKFHPTLFYYSPRTAINLIGDINNIGEKSFTMEDYINFEGGYRSIFEGSNSFSNIFNSDFAQFLNQEDFIYSKNEFGAVSLSQQLTADLSLDAYSIASKGKLKTKTTNNITYLTEAGLNEKRISTATNNMFFTLNKLKLRYQPKVDTDVSYDVLLKTSTGRADQSINSRTALNTTTIQTFLEPKSMELSQFLEYNRQFSYEHTSTITANYKYAQSENTKDWLFDRPVFSGIIPFMEDGANYNLLQNTATETHSAKLKLKHYWVLNNLNHIYPEAGVNFHNQSFATFDFQQLRDGSINSFQNSGFNNDLDFMLVDSYFGFEYKAKWGNLIFKPGLIYHLYRWDVEQFGKEITNKHKGLLLPELEINYELSSSEKLDFNYSLKSNFSDASEYANRLRLTSFNSLFRGNAALENELSHALSLRYYKFNLYRGIFISASANYSEKLRSVQNTTIIEGIDQISRPIYTDLPTNSYGFRGSVAKQLGNFKLSLSGNANLSNYSRIINEELNEYSSRRLGYTFKTETRFDELPNIEAGIQQNFNSFSSEDFSNEFTQVNPYAILEYDFWEDFIFKADYAYKYYKNENNNQINRFSIGNTSLFYHKEDSLWSFEVEVNNVFDVLYKKNNSFNQFYVFDQNIYIQPRTILFTIAYKL